MFSTRDLQQALQKLLTWKGDTFFSHGSCHSKGTMILVKEQLDFKLISSKIVPLGRYILLTRSWDPRLAFSRPSEYLCSK